MSSARMFIIAALAITSGRTAGASPVQDDVLAVRTDSVQRPPPLSSWFFVGGQLYAEPEIRPDYLVGVGLEVVTNRLSATTAIILDQPFATDSGRVVPGPIDGAAFLDALTNPAGATWESGAEWIIHTFTTDEGEVPDPGFQRGQPAAYPPDIPPGTRGTGVYVRLDGALRFADGDRTFDLLGAFGTYYSFENANARFEVGLRQNKRVFGPHGSGNRFRGFLGLRFDSRQIRAPFGLFANVRVDLAGLSVLEDAGGECAIDITQCQFVTVGEEILFGAGVTIPVLR